MHAVDAVRTRWPREDLEYIRLAATTLLALILLPLALVRLLLDPIAAADRALGGAVK
jgi:hypothetical protein